MFFSIIVIFCILMQVGAGNSGAAGKKKGQEEEDLSPPLKASNGKEQRIKDEKNLKVSGFRS